MPADIAPPMASHGPVGGGAIRAGRFRIWSVGIRGLANVACTREELRVGCRDLRYVGCLETTCVEMESLLVPLGN